MGSRAQVCRGPAALGSGRGRRGRVVMGARSVSRFGAVLVVCVGWLVLAGGALAAVTPGGECIPTAAGQAVVAGGAGAAPSWGAGKTAVLVAALGPSGGGGQAAGEVVAAHV